MKILKALILLCLPITSFADVYFCEASHFALLGYDATSSTNVNTKFVVDTSEGVRRDNGQIWGACKQLTDSILECSNGEAGNSETVTLIELGDAIVFTHILNNLFFPVVESHTGLAPREEHLGSKIKWLSLKVV